jgi:phosphate transport system protein
MPDHAHIYRPFDLELQSLKNQLLAMGSLVEAQIADATRALVERDPALSQQVIEQDRQVNAREIAVDEQCIRLLALRQPAASDLRFVASALKIVTDLERIGDLAVNMAERAEALSSDPPLRVVFDLPSMAVAAQRMLRDALDAVVGSDVGKAESVLLADAAIDKMLVHVFDELSAEMQRDPSVVKRAMSLIFFAKHLERLADHTTNIAEMVVYQVRGEDVRHKTKR